MQAVTQRAAGVAHRDSAALGAAAVHAWLVDLDAPVTAAPGALDAVERARAVSFVRPQDGARFTASRAALRLVLGRYLGCEPAAVDILTRPLGRPRVADDRVRFSLARSAGVALIAVSRLPVGADLERIQPRPGLADLVTARFPAREAASVASGCCGPPMLSFYQHWTAKEAYLKAIGLGLAGLRDIELECGTRPGLCVEGQAVDGWSLTPASPLPGYAAAIVGRAAVTSWRWLRADQRPTPAGPAGWCQQPTRARS